MISQTVAGLLPVRKIEYQEVKHVIGPPNADA